MARGMRYALILAFFALAADSPARAQPSSPVVINEVLASNGSVVPDPQGEYDDWIEVYNIGDGPLDLAGMYLTDDLAAPTRWQFPLDRPSLTTIAARGYLLVWADGDTEDPGLHANFKLNAAGEEVALVLADGRTVADHVRFGELPADTSYARIPNGSGTWQPLNVPTPGQANSSPYRGLVADITFTHERGFYNEPFSVAISCATDGALIYYTLDGSSPYDAHTGLVSGTAYTGPIAIRTTTCLRAMAYKMMWAPSEVQTHTYFFIQDVLRQPKNPSGFPTAWAGTAADYEMDPDITRSTTYGPLMEQALLSLPSLSVVMDTGDLFGPNGIYANPTRRGPDWERPASAEWIHPDGGPGFQIDCGIQIQGGAFRTLGMTRKKSLRLSFKAIYGRSKLRYPLFGKDAADTFDTITLRAGANDGYAWTGARYTEQYTRDEFVRSLQRAAGHAGSHGTFVHLYLNGLYWGLYNPCERPDASFSATTYGGDKEDWDALHNGGSTEVIEGDMAAWNQMLGLCRAGLASNEAFQRIQGNDPDGTRNPAYPRLLDVPNYIDYLIVNIWGGNWDWPWKNWYAARDRTAGSTGFKFYCWDCENTMGNSLGRSPLDKNALHNDFSSAGEPHQALSKNAEYRLLFGDRVHRLFFNGGVLSPESLIPRYADLAGVVELAMVCESARWGDQHFHPPLTLLDWYDSDENYNDGRAGRGWVLYYYLPQRSAIVLEQFRAAGLYPNVDAPVFQVHGSYRHGGHMASTDWLSMIVPAGTTGTVYYTLDGSDPRVPDAGQDTPAAGGISPSAAEYKGPITLNRTTQVRARVLSGATWSVLNEAVYTVP